MEDKKCDIIPLINPSPLSSTQGTASKLQTIGNIIVSIVGTGVLSLPYAFRVTGWLAGSLGAIIVGSATFYCMLLLIECRHKLASEEELKGRTTYGDLGFRCIGKPGRYMTEFLICISQCGGSVAYLVFIGQNLASVFKLHGLTFPSYIFLLVPIEMALSWIGSLSAFAPFSIFADLCNLLAMGFVVKEDVQQAIVGKFSFRDREAFNLGGFPFAAGTAVYCFEGFGMTLALEQSMRERKTFPKVLAISFAWIIVVYILFGTFGYIAYGDDTKDVITLNLPNDWTAIAVQIGMCLGLVFTFPMMVHPVCVQKFHNNDSESSITRLGKFGVCIGRAVLVIGLAVLASFVPGFGVLVSLVGSTVCALISFVLPASFHLTLLGSSLSFWQKSLDVFIVLCGLLFAVYGTYTTIGGV
ncbi:amino acid transporter ANT1-like isoform X2 [Hibiscus syriacus]|uniref:amino acid transporter ANT1-like isoform X2 n=1 Tax=Hibiscus syriacus TaxID=106335 RepID=UPI0019238E69|nr:amino acid transporter ANT1-like isoform X2 [Hibiscus syriacus]